RVEGAELRDLLERQTGIVDEPDRGRLGHQKRIGHRENPSRSPASLPRAVGKATNLGKSVTHITLFAVIRNEKPRLSRTQQWIPYWGRSGGNNGQLTSSTILPM